MSTIKADSRTNSIEYTLNVSSTGSVTYTITRKGVFSDATGEQALLKNIYVGAWNGSPPSIGSLDTSGDRMMNPFAVNGFTGNAQINMQANKFPQVLMYLTDGNNKIIVTFVTAYPS